MYRHAFVLLRPAIARLFDDRTGGIALIGGLSLPLVIGGIGLSYDINRGLEQRVMNQRAADVAALGAAMAYKSGNSQTVLQPTAIDIASANGIRDAVVTATIVNNYPNTGDKAVRVRIESEIPYTLASAVGMKGTYTVASQAFASLSSQAQYASPCFLALSTASDAISVTGGASIDAPTCTVAAIGSVDNKGTLIRGADIVAGGGSISVSHGTLSANTLRFAGSFNKPAWNNNVPPADKRINQATTLVDPWATSQALADARALLGTFTATPNFGNPDTASCPNAKDFPLVWGPTTATPQRHSGPARATPSRPEPIASRSSPRRAA